MTRSVKKFYTGYAPKEWNRLIQDPYAKLEFDTTMHFLKKYLPKKCLILDAGGGPGRYTIELAKQGHDVVLLDLTPANLEIAKKQIKAAKLEKKVKSVVEGSITDLSQFKTGSFDAVICLGGPLSHVIDKRKRSKAIKELIRVAKKNAPIMISVMSRLCLLISAMVNYPDEINSPRFKKYRDSGIYAGHHAFTACHFFLPEEIQKELTNNKTKIIETAGLEGLSTNFPKEINKLAKNKKLWKEWMKTHYKTCTHPSVVGISGHILVVMRKK